MPVYEYRCQQGHMSEVRRGPEQASEPIRCVECGAPADRLYRLRGIGFKGPGFHNTDYPRPGALND
jgi:putative FmdB family regulatory protein